MLRISRCKAYRRETETFNAQPKHFTLGELKSAVRSAMQARESLAKRNHRDGDLWDHLRAGQRSPTEDPAVEQARPCFARSGVNGFNRGDDTGARLPCNQLRHACSVARDDAGIGVSLSRALFRMGVRDRPERFANAAAAAAVSDATSG